MVQWFEQHLVRAAKWNVLPDMQRQVATALGAVRLRGSAASSGQTSRVTELA
jgi:hypothetical protein